MKAPIRRRHHVWAIGAIAMMPAHPVGGAAKADGGFVVDLDGAWTEGGAVASEVKRGQTISSGTLVKALPPFVGEHRIAVADRKGRVCVNASCLTPESCWPPIEIVLPSGRSQTRASRLMAAVMSHIRETPGKFVTLLTRGGEPVRDLVVARGPGGVTLRPLLLNKATGTYRIHVERRLDRSSAPLTSPPEMSWSVGQKFKPVLLDDGLYDVRVTGDDDESESAWVLVRSEAKAERCASAFREGVRMAGAWRDTVGEAARRSFVRGYLYVLATEPGTPCTSK